MWRRLGVVLCTVVPAVLVAAPLGVGAGGEPVSDERAQIERVTAFHDEGDAFWLLVCTTGRWGMAPPVLYSLMFGVTLDVSEQDSRFTVDVGWQTHDGESGPFGTGPDGEFEPAASITVDGCVLFGLPFRWDALGPVARGRFASWEDKSTTAPIDGTVEIEIGYGDAPPPPVLFNLNSNEPVTTTTTAAPAETTPPTAPAGNNEVVTTTSTTRVEAASPANEAPPQSPSDSEWGLWGVVGAALALGLTLLWLLGVWPFGREEGSPPTPPPQNNDFGA